VKINEAGLTLIKSFESLELQSYPDPATSAEPWTVGYGHTGPEVHPGMTITEAEADAILAADVQAVEHCVSEAVGQHVNENEFSSCVSLAFNIGCKAFRASTLARMLREGQNEAAADQFLRWNKAAGREMAGLTRRRRAERELFLS
jgi:lysozyme